MRVFFIFNSQSISYMQIAELSVDKFITGIFSFSKSLCLKLSIFSSKVTVDLNNFGGFKSVSLENGYNSNIYNLYYS